MKKPFDLHKLPYLFALPLLLSIIIAGCHHPVKTINKVRIDSLRNLADKSDSVRDLKKSILYYTQILDEDSTHLEALVNRGRALVWDNQEERGFADFDKALMLYPNEIVYTKRGMVHFYAKHYDKADADFRKAIDIYYDCGEAYYGLSLIKVEENDLDSALYFANVAQNKRTDFREVGRVRASIFDKMGNYQALKNELTLLLRVEPSNAGLYNNRGYARISLQKYDDALLDFNECIKLDPQNAYAHNNKAYVLLKLHQPDEALSEANTSLKLDDKNPHLYKTFAEIYLSFHNREKACENVLKAETLAKEKELMNDLALLKKSACK